MLSDKRSAKRIPAPDLLALLKNPALLVAYGFGTGLSPVAPGTIGTLVGVPLVLLIKDWGLASYLMAIIILLVIGVFVSNQAIKASGIDDHPGIVIDEIAGFLITMFAAPPGWQWLVVGFVLFRIFDIAKPPPVCTAERRFSGGLGVMIDDVVAGLMALAVLQVIVIAL